MFQSSYFRERTLNALLYVAFQLDGQDKHAIYRALYLAERKQLLDHASPILEDFVAMECGPVPRLLSSMVKVAEGSYDGWLFDEEEVAYLHESLAHVPPSSIKALRPAQLTYFTKDELASLDYGIEFCRTKPLEQAAMAVYDAAWKGSERNYPMPSRWIAAQNGASEDVLEYLEMHDH